MLLELLLNRERPIEANRSLHALYAIYRVLLFYNTNYWSSAVTNMPTALLNLLDKLIYI